MREPEKITENHDILEPCRTMVIGVGGGGVHAVSHMRGVWTEGPDLVAVHTDGKMLNDSKVARKIQIGAGITNGMGCAGDPMTGKRAAQADYPLVRELFTNVDLAFIVTTLGGGTSTGAAPVIAQVAREEGVMCLCVVSMPFAFEGEEKQRVAQGGLDRLITCSDAVICMPNERLVEQMGAWKSLAHALKRADAELAAGLKALWMLFRQTGIIHLDLSDVRKLVEHDSHYCVLAIGEATGKEKAKSAVQALLKHPVLEGGKQLTRTTGIMVGIMGGTDLTLAEVNDVVGAISEATSGNVRLMVGAGAEKGERNHLTVVVLAAEKRPEPVSEEKEPAPEPEKTSAGKPRGRKQPKQESLVFDQPGRGRFKGVEPTYYEGEDLDIPTFIRRGIRLKDR